MPHELIKETLGREIYENFKTLLKGEYQYYIITDFTKIRVMKKKTGDPKKEVEVSLTFWEDDPNLASIKVEVYGNTFSRQLLEDMKFFKDLQSLQDYVRQQVLSDEGLKSLASISDQSSALDYLIDICTQCSLNANEEGVSRIKKIYKMKELIEK